MSPRPPRILLAAAHVAAGCSVAPAAAPEAEAAPPIRLVTERAQLAPGQRARLDLLAGVASRQPADRGFEELGLVRGGDLEEHGLCVVITVGMPFERTEQGYSASGGVLEVGVLDPEERPWVDALLGGLAELEAWLPLPEGWRPAPGARRFRDAIFVANLAVRGGSRAGLAGPGTHLPLDREAGLEHGRDDVFWKNLTRSGWYGRSVRPFAARLLRADQAELATAGAHLRFYATRFATYQLGPQAVHAGGTTHTLREWFGDAWGPLQIAKADTLGVLAHEWLVERGVQPPETSAENLAMAVVMAFYALADARGGDAPPAHGPASALTLSFLAEHGAIRPLADGTWEVELSAARAALRELARTILRVHAEGDRATAAALLDARGVPSADVERTLDALGPVPAWRAPVEYVIR